jgi:hypothetical protein
MYKDRLVKLRDSLEKSEFFDSHEVEIFELFFPDFVSFNTKF